MGLADLHIHTMYSYDGTMIVPSVLKQAKQIGLDVIAITDTNEIKGALNALELARYFDVEVIPGTEITTAEGDLLALFVQEKVTPGLPLIDTLLEVYELGGLCIAPHLNVIRRGVHSLSGLSIVTALNHPEASQVLVGIETYNAKFSERKSNRCAKILAERAEVAMIGSSNAYTLDGLGIGTTEFPGYTAEHFAVALQNRYTRAVQGISLKPAQVFNTWAVNYLGNIVTRLANVTL